MCPAQLPGGCIQRASRRLNFEGSGAGSAQTQPRWGCIHAGVGIYKGLCVRETEILVEQQPPQGVFVCDHAGLVINKFSLCWRAATRRRETDVELETLAGRGAGRGTGQVAPPSPFFREREFFIENLLVRIHYIIFFKKV